MVIRPATTDDVARVLAVWRDADAVPSATDDEASIAALLEFDPAALLVAEVDGDVVGTLIAAWDGWRGDMYRLAVVPHHRRNGVAAALAAAGEERLRALGCRRITALVVGEHEPAVGFWTNIGYTRQAGQYRYVR
jgi:ribosomal protein S18 acetylase RimI-like enzyme